MAEHFLTIHKALNLSHSPTKLYKQASIPRDGQRAQASIPRDGQKADHLELTNFMDNILLFLKSQKSSF